MAAEQDPLTAFDDPNFRPIDFVNKLFPNGTSTGRTRTNSSSYAVLACLCCHSSPHLRLLSLSLAYFSAEPALEGVDPLIAKLQLKIRRVDNEILEAVREQSSSGTKAKEDLDNAMKAIMVSPLEEAYKLGFCSHEVLFCRITSLEDRHAARESPGARKCHALSYVSPQLYAGAERAHPGN